MVEKIAELRDKGLGFTAKGTTTANDYESVIISAVETMFARQGTPAQHVAGSVI